MTTWDAGMIATADRLNDGPLTAYKTGNETLTNNSTLQNDDDLFVTVAANTVYDVRLKLLYSAPTANDIKVSWTWPSAATFPWGIVGLDTAAGSGTGSAQFVAFDSPTSGVSTFSLGGSGAGNTLLAIVEGTLTTGATAGTLRLQWAQGTAAASTSAVVKAGSVLRAQKIS